MTRVSEDTNRMTVWQRWVRRPQSLWFRKALFQVHLWTGLAIGLYVVMLSVTGSAIVYGPQLARVLDTPTPVFDPSREGLSTEELREAAERSYPGFTVTRISSEFSRRRPAISVTLERSDDVKERLLNPYTGEDLGDVFPIGVRTVLWITSLHDDLLFQRTGRTWNGVGSVLVTLLAISGAIVWWPGKQKWRTQPVGQPEGELGAGQLGIAQHARILVLRSHNDLEYFRDLPGVSTALCRNRGLLFLTRRIPG